MPAAPLPTPDHDSQPFWDGAKAGRLSAQRCPNCQRFRWPPAEYCPHCHHHGGEWVSLPGTGVVRSFVIVHRAFDPGFEDKVPYAVAHIALDGADEVTIIGNVVTDPVDAIAIGQRVAVEFVDAGPLSMPRFKPI
jgi:uncharacterized OB-fold protein